MINFLISKLSTVKSPVEIAGFHSVSKFYTAPAVMHSDLQTWRDPALLSRGVILLDSYRVLLQYAEVAARVSPGCAARKPATEALSERRDISRDATCQAHSLPRGTQPAGAKRSLNIAPVPSPLPTQLERYMLSE